MNKKIIISGRINRILQRIYIISVLPLAVFISLLMRLISPFYVIRIGFFDGSRIGHFSAFIDMYLCAKYSANKKTPNNKYIDIFYIQAPICNQQLYLMWKRSGLIYFLPSFILRPIHRINSLMPDKKKFIIEHINSDKLNNHIVKNYPPHISFTNEEEKRGLSFLQSIGMNKNDKYVCMIIRDNTYLKTILPERDWSYHDYRDCNIDNYMMMAEMLASRGYYVFRMGAKVEKPFTSINPKIIDYAFNGMRSEFLDIYLTGNCYFCISSACGLDAIAHTMRRPQVFTNVVPIISLWSSFDRYIVIFRHHYCSKEKRPLSLKEIIERNLHMLGRTNELKERNAYLIDNTPEEITEVVEEMLQKLEKGVHYTEEEHKLQKLFWQQFISDTRKYNLVNNQGEITTYGAIVSNKIEIKIGKKYLNDNQQILLK